MVIQAQTYSCIPIFNKFPICSIYRKFNYIPVANVERLLLPHEYNECPNGL